MATLHYQTAGGKVVRVLHDKAFQERFPSPGPGESAFEFDGITNEATLVDLRTDVTPWSVVAGQLRKDGTAVSIAADSTGKQERTDFDSQLAAAITRLVQIKTGADLGLTNAQRDAAIGDLAVILRRTLRLLNQLRPILERAN